MKVSVTVIIGLVAAVAVSALPAASNTESKTAAKVPLAGCPTGCHGRFTDTDGKCYTTCCSNCDCFDSPVNC
ncbi:hypothetical protein GQ42DRAFT_163163 [Ramicandelaber brevisporus]|nr:hypothetical protein GQ42DRAFT_163163 [Ramicandelaber brevisporus]